MVNQLIERAPKEIGKPVGALGIKRVLCAGEPGGGLPAFQAARARGIRGRGVRFHGWRLAQRRAVAREP
ncbi:MAG: hypothetical protein MZV49_18260 [Rhodopseudomonas palustris]|nr:hypothetical protein [Rhodopseudomonas palustris]